MVRELAGHRVASADALRRSLNSAAGRDLEDAVAALVPTCVYDDRRVALVASISSGAYRAASQLIAGLPGPMMDQPLAACAAAGLAGLTREIVASRDSADINPGALFHARSVARSKGHWLIVDVLSDFLYERFPDESEEDHVSELQLPSIEQAHVALPAIRF
mmetsp:Transcript_57307/g.129829  ORF Transcript_57307/g.129829 Transcript_57307/m.129829 type:complete len:162 (+) Transcript_57307:2-487(+)